MSAIITHSITRRDWFLLLLVLLIAAIVRLGQPGISEFFHDEALVSMLAQDMADGKTFPVLGMLSSVGIPNPPTSVYVMWLPYCLTSDPLFATMYVAMLNVIGVGLLWLLVHRYFNRTVALIAGLAYALNPWAIFYSRKIWAQDYHTPFVLLALLLGLYGFAENGERNRRRWWAQVLCLPVLLFALQIHFAAWALLPLYAWLLWMGRRRIDWRAMILTVILSALVLLPYGIGLSQTLEQDPDRLRDVFNRSGLSESSSGLSLTGDPIVFMARFATGLGMETWIAPQQQTDFLAKVPPPTVLWLVIGGAALIGLVAIWRKGWRSLAVLVFIWAGLPMLVFMPAWTDVYPHYLIASIPALALLIGIGAVWILDRLRQVPAVRSLALAGFALILLTQGIWWGGLLRYVDETDTPYGFSTPLHDLTAVHDVLAEYDRVVVVSDGMWTLYDSEPARWSVFLHKSASCIGAVQETGYAVFPDGPFAALTTPYTPPDPVDNLYLSAESESFPVRPNEGSGQYTIYTHDSAPEWQGPDMTSIDPVLFDNGVQLTGYHLEQNRLYLQWALPDARPGSDYQYAAHFLDASGERIGQRDNSFWPGRYWCAGDRLITWVDIELPEGVTTLRVGMYLLGSGATAGQYFNANFLDSAGNPAGQLVDIQLMER